MRLPEALDYEWERAKIAASGTFDRANSWSWLLGYAAIWLAFAALGWKMVSPISPAGILALGAASLGAAWLFILIFRHLFIAPRLLQKKTQTEERELVLQTEDFKLCREAIAATKAHTDALWRQNDPFRIAIRESQLAHLRQRWSGKRSAPEDEWLAFGVAHFALPCTELARNNGQLWSKETLESLRKSTAGNSELVSLYGESFDGWEIDWERRFFMFNWQGSGEVKSHYGCGVYPWALDRPPSHLFPEYISAKAWKILQADAGEVWFWMRHNIATLLGQGLATIWARPLDPTADFEEIAPDAWAHFKMTDWDRGAAVVDEKKLYSVHLALAKSKVRDPDSL